MKNNKRKSKIEFHEMASFFSESEIEPKPTLQKNKVSKDKNVNAVSNFSVSLKRMIDVKRYPIIARLTVLRPRADLVKLLEATLTAVDKMPQRLIDYLAKEALFDKCTSGLTDEGRKVLNTGLMPIQERGLYHVWYCDDALLGHRPLLIQRDTAFFKPEEKHYLSGNDAKHSVFSLSDDAGINSIFYEQKRVANNTKQHSAYHQCELKITQFDPEVICAPNATNKLQLDWVLGLDKEVTSVVNISGSLDVLTFLPSQRTAKSKPEDFNFKLSSFHGQSAAVTQALATSLQGEWLSPNKRAAIPHSVLATHPGVEGDFNMKSKQFHDLTVTASGEFKTVTVANLPVMPNSKEEAEEWRDSWLRAEYNAKYRTKKSAFKAQARWLDHAAVQGYELPSLSGDTLLERVTRESNPHAFWHMAAMEDLCPSTSQKNRLSMTLMNGDGISAQELLNYLAAGEPITGFIYSDRYFFSHRQQRTMQALAYAMPQANGYILTLNNEATPPENWSLDSFVKSHDNHDRYWILLGGEQVHSWKCSSSLDFLREAVGGGAFKVEGTPTFTPQSESELPEYLQSALKNYRAEEYV